MRTSTYLLWVVCCGVTASLIQAFDGIDYKICNPLNQTLVPPPPPEFPPEFTSRIEWKWQQTNSTVVIVETHDSILQKGSQIMYIEGAKIYVLYDYKEKQYITYSENDGCSVTGLESIQFYDNKMWLSAVRATYGMARKANPVYMGTEVVRNTYTSKWVSCLYLYQFNITVTVEMHFSTGGWAMPQATPDTFVPVRFVLRGSIVHNATSSTPFNAVGDFIEFNPSPPDDSLTQLPPGTFCPGRFSRTPLNVLPKSFSLVSEIIDYRQDNTYITYESIWYDSEKKLVRRDYKSARGNDPDPFTEIFDFNLGIHYHIDSYMGNCDPINSLDLGDLYVSQGPNGTIRMMTTEELFHSKDATIQYIGTRVTRGIQCDVWVGIYVDPNANRNFTIEWYFTKDNVLEGVGGVVQPASLFRYDVWQGSGQPTVRNILQYYTEAPSQEVFDVAQCFPATTKARLLMYFSVVNNGDLTTVSSSYLKDRLHINIVEKAMLPPLRISRVTVTCLGTADVYMDATLLDKAPVISTNILPPPPPQHALEPAYEFLKGVVGGRWNISLTSTTTVPVVIETRGILRLDYNQVFTTTTTTTRTTTPEATPGMPSPGTTPVPLSPTREHTPPTLPFDTPSTPPTPCSCPVVTCPTKQAQCPTCPACPHCTGSPVGCPSPPPCQRTSCSPCAQCPSSTLSTPCPVCPKCSSAGAPPTCPPAKPCPTAPDGSQLLQQTGDSGASTGMSPGASAGLAIGMLLIGSLLGFALLIVYRRMRATYSTPDRRNILDRYLDNEASY